MAEIHARYRHRWVVAGVLVGTIAVVVGLQMDLGHAPGPGRLIAKRDRLVANMQARALAAARSREAARLAQGRPSADLQARAVARYQALGLPIFCAGHTKKFVALTIDDGPGIHSAEVVDIFRRAGARVSFFNIGRQVSEMPGLTKLESGLGEVGDHTVNHASLSRLSPPDAQSEIAGGKAVVAAATGRPVTLFRSPYGARNAATVSEVQREGMLEVAWDVDAQDNEGASEQTIKKRVADGMEAGNIILLHELHPTSVAALPAILADAKRKGLKLVTVSALLALDPPSEPQLRMGFDGCPPGQAGASRSTLSAEG